jgi:hypothetical protein
MAAFGLAPARLVASQAKTIEELRAGAVSWKAKAGEATARAKSLEAELKLQKKLVERSAIAASKSAGDMVAFERLREQLESTERELAAAREHLMAIEVKLDILEGAANVLDVRTRTALRQRPRESGAPV